jgi:hypothetical protein
MQEGLWLADRNAIPGMSKINPFPATQAQLKKLRPKPVKPPKQVTPPMPPKPFTATKATITGRPRRPLSSPQSR